MEQRQALTPLPAPGKPGAGPLAMECRPQCGACCIALSISTPLPGMPNGKPAGVPCLHLMPDRRCGIYRDPARPACCAGLKPSLEMCGDGTAHALAYLAELERLTAP